MAQVSVEIAGLQRLRNKLQPGKLTGKTLLQLINGAGEVATREVYAGAPSDTGALARSISIQVEATSVKVSSALPYATVLEYGRRPGARMPPPAALAGWARRHGFTGSLFVLARAIARRGIRGRFFMQRAAERTRQALPSLLSRMARDIEARWQ